MHPNVQVEQAQLEEASYQFISLIESALHMLRLQQGILLLDLGYDEEGRQSLCQELAENLLHTGVQGLPAEALHEALGEVLLTELIFRSYYEHMTYQDACLFLQKSVEFRAYVKRYPPVTSSTRRDRPESTTSTGEVEVASEVSEVQPGYRQYYHRGVGSRPGRTLGRTRWRLDRAVRE